MSDNSFWEAAGRMMSMGLLADGVRGQPGEEREAVQAKVLERTAKHLAALHDEWTEEARRAGRAEAFEIAAALASGDPRDSWEQQAMADHLRTLAAKEREG